MVNFLYDKLSTKTACSSRRAQTLYVLPGIVYRYVRSFKINGGKVLLLTLTCLILKMSFGTTIVTTSFFVHAMCKKHTRKLEGTSVSSDTFDWEYTVELYVYTEHSIEQSAIPEQAGLLL